MLTYNQYVVSGHQGCEPHFCQYMEVVFAFPASWTAGPEPGAGWAISKLGFGPSIKKFWLAQISFCIMVENEVVG